MSTATATEPRPVPVPAEDVRRELHRVRDHLRAVGSAAAGTGASGLFTALAHLFALTGEARLETLTVEWLEAVHRGAPPRSSRRRATCRLARALHGMGLLPRAIPHRSYARDGAGGVDPTWVAWCERWLATSTLAPRTRRSSYYGLLKAGRWLVRASPVVRGPDAWARDIALAYVAAVNALAVGDFSAPGRGHLHPQGAPISANDKVRLLGAVRALFRDAQEWGWCARRFDPHRVFATPRAVRAQIGPAPRVIADDIWAKLLWAGLHLEAGDLPAANWDPLPLVRALTLTWLFAGLRSDELLRRRVGGIRRQAGAAPDAPDTCLLDVPTHQTGASYTKPVDPLVGEAIAAWEAARPAQPPLVDAKTGERVALRFCFRGRPLPKRYRNLTVIPALCRKAGVPREDARGRLTSHRARTTIATQRYNAKEPMTLFELQAWLGHRSPLSTQYYAKIQPTTLARAYADAGYFARNVRAIAVLVDRAAVASGAAAAGAPWQYYDLGHGYCTYSFFAQCPHRMACARCDFSLPKDATAPQLLEARGNARPATA